MTEAIREVGDGPQRLGPGEGRADSELRRFIVGDQPVLVLKQRGRLADMAYDHGRLLAPEIDAGAFPEILSTIMRGIDRDRAVFERLAAMVYQCFSSRIFGNASPEFRRAVDALAEGYLAGSRQPTVTRADVRDAAVAIEVGNLIDGLSRRFDIRFVRVAAVIGVLAQSLPYAFNREVRARLHRLKTDAPAPSLLDAALHTAQNPARSLAQLTHTLASPRNRHASGCTGFCAGGTFTRDGRHIHGRNFDADLYRWNAAPLLCLMDETPANRNWHKYVAFGTAGLIYPGGISGLNDAGLAVSLHQLSTTRYRSAFPFASGDIAPFFEQRLLREAATLDEAADIARNTAHFAAWTVFCSDAKTGEGMRIEVNGDRIRITRSKEPMPQSNHFLHPDMVERAFDQTDGHFTPTFAKWLETHARLALVEEALAETAPQGEIDVDWGIELLASGTDWYLKTLAEQVGYLGGGAFMRAFGRVPRKAYGQLTSIVAADPERRDGRDEVWMTAGDRRPACQSSHVGWTVQWNAFEVTPVDDRPVRRSTAPTRVGRSNWEKSLQIYIEACLAVTRPCGADGRLLTRDSRPDEHQAALTQADALLGAAIDLATADGVVEIPYHYMRARIRHQRGDLAGAQADWGLLLALWAKQIDRPAVAPVAVVATSADPPLLHPFEAVLVLVLSTVTEDLVHGDIAWPGRGERLEEARDLLSRIRSDVFGRRRPGHFNIDQWLELIDRIEQQGGAEVSLPEENFITVE